MPQFEFITTFDIQKQGFNDLKGFIAKDFTSPYLEKKRNSISFSSKPKSETKSKEKFSFSDIEEGKQDVSETDLREISEDSLNDSLDELTAEDYEDFGEIGIELLDYLLDRGFLFMGRQPAENDKIANKKKERLKIIAGKLFQKWGVKFSLEMLGGFLLVSYIHMRYVKSEKIDKEEGKTPAKKSAKDAKVIQLKSVEKKLKKEVDKKQEKAPVKKAGLMG